MGLYGANKEHLKVMRMYMFFLALVGLQWIFCYLTIGGSLQGTLSIWNVVALLATAVYYKDLSKLH